MHVSKDKVGRVSSWYRSAPQEGVIEACVPAVCTPVPLSKSSMWSPSFHYNSIIIRYLFVYDILRTCFRLRGWIGSRGNFVFSIAYYATYAPVPAYDACTCAFAHGATERSGTSATALYAVVGLKQLLQRLLNMNQPNLLLLKLLILVMVLVLLTLSNFIRIRSRPFPVVELWPDCLLRAFLL